MSIPIAARWLGFAGLLPFLGAAVAALVTEGGPNAFAVRALLAYGAVILSFLGGVRWGFAITTGEPERLPARLAFSVVPSLAGWVALLLPAVFGLLLLALCFALMLLADLRPGLAPAWYIRLRLPLSVGAVACLLLGLGA